MTPSSRSRVLCAVGLAALVLTMSGCAGSLYNWVVRTNSTPLSSSLHPARLNQDTIAIFTPLSLVGLRGTETGLGQYLGDVIKEVAPSWNVMEEQQVVTLINRHELAAEYSQMRFDAEQSHILDGVRLRQIGRAIGARYVLQPRLIFFSQVMTDRWTFPVLDIRITQTRSSILRLSVQLWDTETGELLWTSVAEAVLESEAASQEPVFLEAAARVTLGSIVEDFRYRRTTSKYTPLNTLLDRLIQEPPPEPESEPEEIEE